jgi:hypothetical protein
VDKFVTGLKNGLIKDRLIEENHEKLGLPEVLKSQSLRRVLYSEKTLRISITFNYIKQIKTLITFNTNHPSSKGDHSNNILMFKGRNVKYTERVYHTSKKCFYKDYKCDRCHQRDIRNMFVLGALQKIE